MNTPETPTAPCTLVDDYAPLTELYLLRVVCAAAAANPRIPVNEICDELIGVDYSSRKDRAEAIDCLAQRLREIERNPPQCTGLLFDNLARLGKSLGMSPVEIEVLGFRILTLYCMTLDNALNTLGNLTDAKLAAVIACALKRQRADVERALSPQGILIRSALFVIDPDMEPFLQKLRLFRGLHDAVLHEQSTIEDLLSFALNRAPEPALGDDDFSHIADTVQMLVSYLRATADGSACGINILLYGVPGAGKTELARLLAKLAKLDLYEIGASTSDGYELPPPGRLSRLRVNQAFLATRHNAAILFDEVEDVLGGDSWIDSDGSPARRQSKAWINRMLEQNKVPTIWIANRIDDFDPAFLRRFDITWHLKPPPQAVRMRLLAAALDGTGISKTMLEQFADDERITPALALKAGRVMRSMERMETITAEDRFRRFVTTELDAQGFRRAHNTIGFLS